MIFILSFCFNKVFWRPVTGIKIFFSSFQVTWYQVATCCILCPSNIRCCVLHRIVVNRNHICHMTKINFLLECSPYTNNEKFRSGSVNLYIKMLIIYLLDRIRTRKNSVGSSTLLIKLEILLVVICRSMWTGNWRTSMATHLYGATMSSTSQHRSDASLYCVWTYFLEFILMFQQAITDSDSIQLLALVNGVYTMSIELRYI
jgi:hypothetical protein